MIILIATMEIVDLLDRTDSFSELILQSKIVHEYIEARERMNNDPTAQRLIKEFNDMKVFYEEVERFGRYHPDYNKIMKNIRAKKRDMDMNEYVATFKVAERNVQRLLDDISEVLAHSVSENIMVPKDGAIFTEGGCASGNCASGGTCSCKVS
ncbi:MAG TPA: YlbF family regulator [Bacillota bacterium]|nr:YlbF family regulator [Bacillota bacterium]